MEPLCNIDWPVKNGGDITIGRIATVECAATAADGPRCLAMRVRDEQETLMQLLERLDDAIRCAWEDEDGDLTNEINGISCMVLFMLIRCLETDSRDDRP